jgi:long-chain-fatty-acid--CoA ligase ACSBG
VWEKFEEKLKEVASTKGKLAMSISGWAKGLGSANTLAKANGTQPPLCYSFANFLILKRIKAALGLDQCRGFLYGAAPIKATTLEYFGSLDIPILGAYGMSETTGAGVVSPPLRYNMKSTGKVTPGTEIKLHDPDEKNQGEICFRGRHVMMGYLKNEAATKETIDG